MGENKDSNVIDFSIAKEKLKQKKSNLLLIWFIDLLINFFKGWQR